MLWLHNTDQPVGVWDVAHETDKGLYLKGRILTTSLGNDVYELAKAGAIAMNPIEQG
jgi:HK97 family phage prohead protease